MAIWNKNVSHTFHIGDNLKTTTSQYKVVSLVAETSTATRTVELCGNTGTYAEPTIASFYAIGINQNYLSAGSLVTDVAVSGFSKAICAESVTTGDWIKAYDGASTTTMAGKIARVGNAGSVTVATQSIASHGVILGRAMQVGTTNTVIEVLLMPQLYDTNLM